MSVMPEIEAAAKTYYDPGLPYHNFRHATSAMRAGMQLVRQCRRKGVKVDEEVVCLALLWHDAGYNLDFSSYGSREALAAHLAGQELANYGVPSKTIKQVQAAILATHKDAAPKTKEEMIVRIADIFNVGRTYRIFMTENRKVRAEAEQLMDKRLTDDEWKKMSLEILDAYLVPNEINADFVRRAKVNLKRFAK